MVKSGLKEVSGSAQKIGDNKLARLKSSIESRVIGQKDLVESMLVCLLCDGHMLIEGMPGLAKTTAAKALANGIDAEFHRVQFTPDLLPSDLIGTDIFIQEKGNFSFRKGPIFHNILLADEINRAPAKVQSALLEAMEEKQVTVGHESYKLPELFMVIATQNPIEQEGTYNLPEAQLDRFLMNPLVSYPNHEEELRILELDDRRASGKDTKAITIKQEDVFRAKEEAAETYIDPKLKDYIVSLVAATREPGKYDPDLAKWIECGASPRASIALMRCSRALAWLNGDKYVSPYHIQKLAPSILRHRIILSFGAEAENISRETVIKRLIEIVAVP